MCPTALPDEEVVEARIDQGVHEVGCLLGIGAVPEGTAADHSGHDVAGADPSLDADLMPDGRGLRISVGCTADRFVDRTDPRATPVAMLV